MRRETFPRITATYGRHRALKAHILFLAWSSLAQRFQLRVECQVEECLLPRNLPVSKQALLGTYQFFLEFCNLPRGKIKKMKFHSSKSYPCRTRKLLQFLKKSFTSTLQHPKLDYFPVCPLLVSAQENVLKCKLLKECFCMIFQGFEAPTFQH